MSVTTEDSLYGSTNVSTGGAVVSDGEDTLFGGVAIINVPGLQGVTGEKGDKGDTGETGATPDISVAATTLSEGSSATVTKTGTAEAPLFTFGIPTGATGATGAKGDKGDKGDTGDTGATPDISAAATTLPAGSSATVTKTGTTAAPLFTFGIPTGATGAKGDKGDKGDPGSDVWGTITGTLSDQTDLQSALGAKQDTISDLATIRSGAALGATAQQPATTLAGYGIADASISGTTITLGSNTAIGLPAQASMSGKFLTTDGSTASWATVDALPTQSGMSGKFLTTDGSAASWSTVDALPSQTGQSGKYLTTNGTTASWASLDADAFFVDTRTVSAESATPQSFTLSAFSALQVYIDGILATVGTSYTISGYVVTFTSVLPVDTEVKFIGYTRLSVSGMPTASSSQLGVVKVGSNLAIDANGVLTADYVLATDAQIDAISV